MCGRYELIDGQRVWVRFGIIRGVPPIAIADNVDVRPTQQVLVLRADHTLSLMKWGLVPSWARDPRVGSHMINARAEGIESKPSFRRPLRSQRCIIPASAFFEWQGVPGAKAKEKVKYRIARQDGELFGFAGLYDVWRDPYGGDELTTCTIITTQPNAVVAPIHNRMPVMLLPEDEERWLDPEMTDPGDIVSMLRPYPSELLVACPTPLRGPVAQPGVARRWQQIDLRWGVRPVPGKTAGCDGRGSEQAQPAAATRVPVTAAGRRDFGRLGKFRRRLPAER